MGDTSENPLEATTIDFDRPDSLVGQYLEGRFYIEKNLRDAGGDEGGIGIVFLATDTKLLGRRVVIKILNENALKLTDLKRKFQHEKEALIRLDHPGVVKILDSGSLADGNPFIVMEFVEGESLRKALHRQAVLPLHIVAHIVYALMDALGAAHAKSVLHRDVKPENIMLTPVEGDYDRLRLIDFGIAKVGDPQLAPQTEIARAIGTVLYMAPEQLIGMPDITPAADIYSAGVVIYEILTGSLPFKPKSMPEMYLLQQQGVRLPPRSHRADLPEEAERLLMSALSFDAARRPQNARAFGRELARALRGNGAYEPASIKDDEFLHSIKTQYYPMLEDLQPKESQVVQPLPTLLIDKAPATPASAGEAAGIASTVPPGGVSVRSPWLMWAGLAAALLVVVLSGVGVFVYLGRTDPTTMASPAVPPADVPKSYSAELTTYLMVQKTRNGKPFGEAFKSAGQETLENGYSFTFNVQSSAAGYIYIFNEGPGDKDDETVYSVLFPTKMRPDPRIETNATVMTSPNTLSGGRGTEKMWVIWTKQPNSELENAAHSIGARGMVIEPGLSVLKTFLENHRSDPREVNTESDTKVIKGFGDIVLDRFLLSHR